MATGGSTAGTPIKASGAAPASQSYEFNDMTISARLKTNTIPNRENMRNVISRSLKEVYNETKNSKNDFYLLHTWSSPIPISLTSYITAVSRNEGLKGGNLSLTLKMPFALMRTVFSDEVDTITTGQFITVRHYASLDMKTETASVYEKLDNGSLKITKSKVKPRTTSFFGMITSIQQTFSNVEGIDNYAQVQIEARDFIEPIRNCNYVIMPGNLQKSEDGGTESVANNSEMKFLSNFIMSSKEWAKHIKEMADFASAEHDFQEVIQNFITNFGYMLVPPSVGMSVLEFVKISKAYHLTISKGVAAQVGVGNQQTNTSAGSTWTTPGDMQFTAFLMSLQNQYQYFKSMDMLSSMAGRELGFLSRKEIIARAKARAKAGGSAAGARGKADASVENATTGPTPRSSRTGGMNNTLLGDRIGDIIVVATKKSDVPKSSIWYQMLPEKPPYQRFITKFQGALNTRGSAWNRVIGTFVSDDRMIELIPTLIPFYEEDLKTDVSGEIRKVEGKDTLVSDGTTVFKPRGRITKALGAQPTLIYRIKPRHWNTQLNKDFLNKQYSSFVESYDAEAIYPIQYPLSAEDDSVKSNVSIKTDELLQNSLLPLSGDNVFDFNATWVEANRINGTYIESSLLTNRSGFETGVLSSPIIDIYDAYKYGLRLFEGTYPYFNVRKKNGDKLPTAAAGAKGGKNSAARLLHKKINTAFAEEMYLTYGNGNRYAQGSLTCNFQGSADWGPGKWGYMFLRPFGEGSDEVISQIGSDRYQEVAGRGATNAGRAPGGSNDYSDPTQAAYKFGNYNTLGGTENVFFFYIDSISHNQSVDFRGHKMERTTINFSRGSWHKLPPIMPEVRFVEKAVGNK